MSLTEPATLRGLPANGQPNVLRESLQRAQDWAIPPPRERLASDEEISSSMLLSEEDAANPSHADVEELSSSLLLDDPSAARAPGSAGGRKVHPGAASDQGPERPQPRSVKPPPPLSAKQPPPRSVKPPPPPSARLPPPRSPALPPAPRAPSAMDRAPEKLGSRPEPSGAAPVMGAPEPAVGPAPESPVLAVPETTGRVREGIRTSFASQGEADAAHEAETLPIGSMHALLPVSPAAQADPAEAEVPQAEPALDTPPSSTDPFGADVDPEMLPRNRMAVGAEALNALRKLNALVRTRLLRPFDDGLPPSFLWTVTGGGMALGIGAALTVILSLRRPEGDPRVEVLAVASAPVRPVNSAIAGEVAQGPVPPEPSIAVPQAAALKACTVSGAPRVLAPAALLAPGIEARALGDEVALGFASADREAVALRLDPSSSSAPATATAKSRSPIRRATPVLSSKGALGVAVDVDAKNDVIAGRRTLTLEPRVQVGAASGAIVWARQGGPPAGKLWTLDADGDVQALRAAFGGAGEDGPVALAFRQGNAINLGLAEHHETLAATGGLLRFEGLGANVGSPAVAINDGVVVAAWADRASADAPWGLRWIHFAVGQAPAQPTVFSPPPGGRGDQAMSPALAAVAGKRFLLVWTEGSASGHDVRAVTLSEDGDFVGSPLNISSIGSNAGQGQAVVTAGGQGIIAFLESSDDGFRVVATPIACDL
jgi:hypothetical protein